MIGARTRCPWGENLCATSSTFAGRCHMIGKVVTGCVAILPYHTATQDRGSECRDFGFISRIVTALIYIYTVGTESIQTPLNFSLFVCTGHSAIKPRLVEGCSDGWLYTTFSHLPNASLELSHSNLWVLLYLSPRLFSPDSSVWPDGQL